MQVMPGRQSVSSSQISVQVRLTQARDSQSSPSTHQLARKRPSKLASTHAACTRSALPSSSESISTGEQTKFEPLHESRSEQFGAQRPPSGAGRHISPIGQPSSHPGPGIASATLASIEGMQSPAGLHAAPGPQSESSAHSGPAQSASSQRLASPQSESREHEGRHVPRQHWYPLRHSSELPQLRKQRGIPKSETQVDPSGQTSSLQSLEQ